MDGPWLGILLCTVCPPQDLSSIRWLLLLFACRLSLCVLWYIQEWKNQCEEGCRKGKMDKWDEKAVREKGGKEA
jgi:hypothetical protein